MKEKFFKRGFYEYQFRDKLIELKHKIGVGTIINKNLIQYYLVIMIMITDYRQPYTAYYVYGYGLYDTCIIRIICCTYLLVLLVLRD